MNAKQHEKYDGCVKSINNTYCSGLSKIQTSETYNFGDKAFNKNTISLELLEKDFDKAFVDLDLLIGELELEHSELVLECRRKLTIISGMFVQFTQRAQIMYQHNYNLQKELLESNEKLIEALAGNSILEDQSHALLLRVHTLQCQLYSKTAPHESDIIKKKLDKEIKGFRAKNMPHAKLQAEFPLLQEENLRLRSLLRSMHGEIHAARLNAKYLEKELAGRIQQIQLLGRDMRGVEYDHLWNQLEAEINLNRYKSFINAHCHQKPTESMSAPKPALSRSSSSSTCNSIRSDVQLYSGSSTSACSSYATVIEESIKMHYVRREDTI